MIHILSYYNMNKKFMKPFETFLRFEDIFSILNQNIAEESC
jgi:hypothetical protein